MQNKPNFQKSQMNVSIFLQMPYENKCDWTLGENKPNSNPIKPKTNPISEMPKMNLNIYPTMNYKNLSRWRGKKTNPIQTQFKPNFRKMNVNFCFTVYYENKQKAVEKPLLLQVNSEPLSKDWRNVRFF